MYNDLSIGVSINWKKYEGEFHVGKRQGYGMILFTNNEKFNG